MVCVLALNLGQESMARMDDEGLYVQIAWEMFCRADIIVPTWFYEPAWYKPPLTYWSMFPWFALLGRSLLAGRIPALLFGLASLLLAERFGRRITGDPSAGLLCALLLCTMASFVKYSRLGMMEPSMMFLFLLALYALYRAWEGSAAWRTAFYAVVGFSTLIKGPISVLLLGLTAVLFCLWARQVRWLFGAGAWGGMLLGSVGVAIWPVGAWLSGEWPTFWSFFIVRENLGKFDNIYYPPHNIWGAYLAHMAPWPLMFLMAALGRKPGSRSPGEMVNLAFIVAVLGVFMLPATRLTWYSVPALPSAAIVLGCWYATQARHATGQRILEAMTAVLMALMGLVMGMAARVIPLGLGGGWAGIGGIGAVTAAVLLLSGPRRLMPATVGMAVAWLGLSGLSGFWPYAFVTPEGRAALVGENVAVVRYSPYAWSWEAGHLVTQITEAAQVEEYLGRGWRIISAESYLREFNVSYRELHGWTILKQRLQPAEVWEALKSGDSSLVEERMVVVERP